MPSPDPNKGGAMARDIEFRQEDFDFVAKLLRDHCGIDMGPAKTEIVYGRLAPRLRRLGLTRFADYCRHLAAPDGEAEIEFMVNALTTNLTRFFREQHHYDYLADVLGELADRARANHNRLRIWSAGCATGEEAYSAALVLARRLSPGLDVRILATDLDSRVLARARQGSYPISQLDQIPEAFRQGLVRLDQANNLLRFEPRVMDLVRFRHLNLIDPWPMSRPFDVVFFRNVAIYFSEAVRRNVVNRMADIMAPDGLLFIGHSETLARVSDRFKAIGPTIYRRVS